MPSFQEHINQAKRNLDFLSSTNSANNSFWDWQVTICFYVGVHLINAHIAQKSNMHYRKHDEVNNTINPFLGLSPCRLSELEYLAYMKLQHSARRSRYLVHDDPKNKSTDAHFTHDKHFKKSIKHLDTLMKYMNQQYRVDFNVIGIDCPSFVDSDIKYFRKKT